ncbi:MAG: TIGR01777 family oxidoreductase [Actinomycetes bacterium]
MRVAITGSSGLIGRALTANLIADGHEVLRLVRRTPAGPDEVQWDPTTGSLDPGALEGVGAIVNLAGAGVGDHRWTPAYKAEILDSRVNSTRTIARAAAEMAIRPSVLVSASAIGFYGDRGDAPVDETSSVGEGFLANVCVQWEAAADPAREAGIRVAHPRTGLVVSRHGGAWEKLIKLFKLGVGGRMGSGNQYWSFISMRDEIRALRFLIDNPQLSGAVNLTAPEPVTNRQAVRDLADTLHRPAALPVPSFALKLALGEFSTEVLGSGRVLPRVLEQADFRWQDPTMSEAVRSALAE